MTEEQLKDITTMRADVKHLADGFNELKSGFSNLSLDLKSYMQISNEQSVSRDKECGMHTKDLAVLSEKVINQEQDIQILFTNQKEFKGKMEEMDGKFNGLFKWVIGTIFVGCLLIAGTVWASIKL